jgi:peptide chain release factor subunit 1
MVSREILAELMSFHPDPYLTTTLYLPIENSRQPEYLITLKDILKESRQKLADIVMKPEARKSAESDLKKIADFVRLKFVREGARTLVVFSCSGQKLWRTLTLKMSLPPQLIFQRVPYLRPLTMVLEDYSRFLVILLGRSRARLFEGFVGEILEHSHILDEVPGKVRMGGFAGSQERKIERHIEDHVRRHFKHVSGNAYDLFKKHAFDWIVLLGTEQNTGEFRHYLPQVLQDRVVAVETEEIGVSPRKVLKRLARIEQDLRQRQERRLLDRLFDEVNSGGLGIVGLDAIVRALKHGQVNFLVVEEGFTKNGFRCVECRSLFTENSSCDYCGAKTTAVRDLVGEVVEEALIQGCQVKVVTAPDQRMNRAGRIGAVLRFRT